MTFTRWFVVAFCALSHAMKRSTTARRPEIDDTPVDLFALLPGETLIFHIMPYMDAPSILVLSMTSKRNLPIFTNLLASYFNEPEKKLTEEFFDFSPIYNKTKSSVYYMMKNHLSKAWPTSDDCLLRFRLKHLHYSMLTKANNLPRASPYPVFFTEEREIPYIQVPGIGALGWSALAHRVYRHCHFNADLLTELPIEVIEELSKAIHPFLEEVPENMCETLVHNKELLKKLVGTRKLLGYFMDGENELFKLILKSGLDDYLEDQDDEDVGDDMGFPVDVCTLALIINETNDKNLEKAKKLLSKIDLDDIREHSYILCRSKLDPYFILEQLFRDDYIDSMLVYALLIDEGRKLELEWFTNFYIIEDFTKILDSFSEDIGDFTIPVHDDEPNVEGMIFVAVCRNAPDNLIMALIKRTQIRCLLGAFFFLLVSGRSEELIRYMLTSQMNEWENSYTALSSDLKNIPSKVNIPNGLLPDIIRHFKNIMLPCMLIPDPEKYAAALQYIDEHDLWTEDFSLLSIVQHEIISPHPIILQAVLDLATKRDFCSFALKPIFKMASGAIHYQTAETALERLPVMEYLRAVPLERLVEVIEKAGPQNPDILNPLLPGPIQASMLPLIYRIVFADPKASSRILFSDRKVIHKAIIEEAWENIFRCSPSVDSNVVPSFFELVDELEKENAKALSIIYPIAYLSLNAASKDIDSDLSYPADYTFWHKSITQKVLAEVAALASDDLLIEWFAMNWINRTSPFTEASFKELMRRPKGLIHLFEERLIENSDLMDLLLTHLPPKYITEDLVEAVQNENLKAVPWIITGLNNI